ERTKSIRDGDNNQSFLREPIAPVQGHRGRPVGVPPAVYPDQHRQAPMHAFRRRPDVEVETIFTQGRGNLARHGHTNLHTRGGKRIRPTGAGPRCDWRWWPPPQITYRWGSEGNTFVDTQPVFAHPGYCAKFRHASLSDRDA